MLWKEIQNCNRRGGGDYFHDSGNVFHSVVRYAISSNIIQGKYCYVRAEFDKEQLKRVLCNGKFL